MKKKSFFLTAVATLSFATATIAQNLPSYVPTNGLMGWWSFNNNFNDQSVNGYNGNATDVTFSSDRFGNPNSAANFPNGNTTSKIILGSQLNYSVFSISVWIKPTGQSTSGFHTVISQIDQFSNPLPAQNNFTMQQSIPDPSYKMACVYGGNNSWQNGGSFGNGSASLNNWHHLLVTFNGQKSKTYYNSVLVDSAIIVNYYNPISILAVGDRHLAPNYEFNFWGLIDDIGIWNRALTQQEITDLYNANICYQTITVTDTLIINTNLVGFNPITYQNTIKIYPNPTNDHITINYGNFASLSGYQLKIENSLGQQVFQTSINQQSNYLNLSNWGGNGIYFVRIIDPQGNTVDIRKIVLQ